jgi:diguanylate cyclase (GGDEF)-like protein
MKMPGALEFLALSPPNISYPAGDSLHLAAEGELSRPGHRLRFTDAALEQAYRLNARATSRALNCRTLALIVILVDSFFITEHRVAPEIFVLAAWLRFGLLTPVACVLILLEWRGKLPAGHVARPFMWMLPSLVVAVIIARTTSLTALPNLQSTPLIAMVIMTARIGVMKSVIVNLVCVAAYIAAIVISPCVPAAFLPSMIFIAVAIGTGAVAYAIRVDLRERQLFLLGLQNERWRAQLARHNAFLTRLSQVDALTGLANRRCFDDALREAWNTALARAHPVSLVIFDIDHFKKYNDAFGHQAGDECLRVVGRAIAQCVRDASDTAARYGGEEFAIILPGAASADACDIAERVNAAVMACAIAHPCAGAPGCVTVSLGVATIVPSPRATPTDLIEAADRCLYTAKRNGRNQFSSIDYAPDMFVKSPENISEKAVLF